MNKPTSGTVSIWADKALFKAYKQLCDKNPRSQSVSQELGKFMLTQIKTKGRKRGIKVPSHLLPE